MNASDVLHQDDCPLYEGGIDADKMRERLNGVEIGMWADTVLTIHPRSKMVMEPIVVGNEGEDTLRNAKYIVNWVYPGFTLTFARGVKNDPRFGDMSIYAVQKIQENDYQNKKRGKNARRKGRAGFR